MHLKIWFISIILIAGVWSRPGTVSTLEVKSETLQRTWKIRLYLPDGYDNATTAYPVLYLLHGSGGDQHGWDQAFPVLDSLIDAKSIPPLIAVAPASGTSWWVDGREAFETAFFRDLIPELDKSYRTIKHRNGRIIAGYSMGGYGALRYALVHCDVFAAATLLSPALYSQQPPPESSAITSGAFGDPFDPRRWTASNYPAALGHYLEKGLQTPVFILVGDDDWNHPEGFFYNMEQQAVLLYGQLNRAVGSPAELRIVDGGHDWKLWKPGFIDGLGYMISFISENKMDNEPGQNLDKDERE